jgi:ligand-binding SRPBCC domain-containing protein
MTTITLTTDIAAPIDRVFDLARDLDLHAASMAATGERAIRGRTAGRIELGETVTWRARHFGVWWTLTSRITEMARPAGFADEQVAGPFARFHHEHRFETTPGGTRMTDVWMHRSPFGVLGLVADRLFLDAHMRKLLSVRNAALKTAAERTPA